MKMYILNKIVIFFTASILISQFTGCTAIGFGLGAISDSRGRDYTYCPIHTLSKLNKGSVIKIIKKNGEELSGKLIGLELHDEQEYMKVYNEYRVKGVNEDRWPALGEISILVASSGKQFGYHLLGFDYDGIIVRKAGSRGYAKKTFVLVKGAELIDREGNKISINSLERLVTIGEIPILSALKLQTASGEISIDLGEIEMIQIHKKKNGKIKGLLYGAMIDAATLIILSLTKPFEGIGGMDLDWTLD